MHTWMFNKICAFINISYRKNILSEIYLTSNEQKIILNCIFHDLIQNIIKEIIWNFPLNRRKMQNQIGDILSSYFEIFFIIRILFWFLNELENWIFIRTCLSKVVFKKCPKMKFISTKFLRVKKKNL